MTPTITTATHCPCGALVLPPYRHCCDCLADAEAAAIDRRGGLILADFSRLEEAA